MRENIKNDSYYSLLVYLYFVRELISQNLPVQDIKIFKRETATQLKYSIFEGSCNVRYAEFLFLFLIPEGLFH